MVTWWCLEGGEMKTQMIYSKDTFPARLKQARERCGFSQAQLARKAKIPASSISHFESGAREPALSSFRSLCFALGVSAEYLIGQDDSVRGVPSDELKEKYRKLSMSETKFIQSLIDKLS